MIDIDAAHNLWNALHGFTSKVDLDQKTFLLQWLDDVASMLWCQTCFRKINFFLSRWPVSFGEGFHLWGLALHDYVNKELGRELFFPQLTLEPLRKRGIIY